ncbi:MAG TPA: GrpB family protein, partial [Streptosporangiaceae bacterium]|nr:GrpB family protein [Streptosporangiaceae bacterium]
MPIEVLDYDPGWPATAAAAIAELRRALPGLFTELEHIGSTGSRPAPDIGRCPPWPRDWRSCSTGPRGAAPARRSAG